MSSSAFTSIVIAYVLDDHVSRKQGIKSERMAKDKGTLSQSDLRITFIFPIWLQKLFEDASKYFQRSQHKHTIKGYNIS